MEKRKNEIGKKYGRLTVVGKSDRKTKSGASFWICECECGHIKEIAGTLLRNGQSKSCGCMNGGESNLERGREVLYKSLKSGAIRRGLIFDIDYTTFKILSEQNCYLCGDSPSDKHSGYSRRRHTKNKDTYVVCNSLNRIDNTIGYSIDNVKSCCFMCNRIKSDFELDKLLIKIKKINEKWNVN